MLFFLFWILIAYKFSDTERYLTLAVYHFKPKSIECLNKSGKPFPLILHFFIGRHLNENDSEDKNRDRHPIQGKIILSQKKKDSFLPLWIFPINLWPTQELYDITITDTGQQNPKEIILVDIRKEDWQENSIQIIDLLEK
jgi:hypothetical protein